MCLKTLNTFVFPLVGLRMISTSPQVLRQNPLQARMVLHHKREVQSRYSGVKLSDNMRQVKLCIIISNSGFLIRGLLTHGFYFRIVFKRRCGWFFHIKNLCPWILFFLFPRSKVKVKELKIFNSRLNNSQHLFTSFQVFFNLDL